MELPQIKMKKKSNVKNPTSIIPSLKTLKITLSNHRANPQKSLKWRSPQKKRVIKNFKEVPQVCPQVSETSFKCALRRGKKKVIKKRFKEVLQVCPQRKKVVKKSLKEVVQVLPKQK
jgi:hypothetical protein